MSSKKFATSTTRMIRDEARFYGFNTEGSQNPVPTLWGKAGKIRAGEARMAIGNRTPYLALLGRRNLMSRLKSLPWNAKPPENIEDTARLVGWVKAAEEVSSNREARKVLKALYSAPARGTGSVYNAGGEQPWLTLKKWASPTRVTEFAAKAVAWLASWSPWFLEKATTRFLDKLGRLKPLTRFAAIHGLERNAERVSHREIRWDLVEKAQSSVHAALAFVPEYLLGNYATHSANAEFFQLWGVSSSEINSDLQQRKRC